MISYMLPLEEKSPENDRSKYGNHLAFPEVVSNGMTTSTPISKETSISSFVSDGTIGTTSQSSVTSTSEKGKPKLIVNGGKHQSLKRVSFGSSKGSMVETLIFESPVQEEAEPSPIPELAAVPFEEFQDQTEAEREKVRVTFYQQSKPQEVDLPDEPISADETDFMMAAPAVVNSSNHVVYNRTESTESGWENPFRPGGDLSREADEIVELIKEGKPITPTPGSNSPTPALTDQLDHHNHLEPEHSPQKVTPVSAVPRAGANGYQSDKPGAVEVKRGTVKPDGDASQVEHVTLKKKPKCECCVIQ